LSRWPSFPPTNYLGQLDPEFQAWLKSQRQGITRSDCEWYHTSVLSSGDVIQGAWDLRGGETAYLGGVSFAGKRVLELGPATGYLTFWMERAGAEVVGLEAGFDIPVDLIPFEGRDMRVEKGIIMETVDRVHNSWWFMHEDLGSRSKLVHGDIYRQPADLGHFDTSVFGAILLHLRDPWGAIAETARKTKERIIITDVLEDDIDPASNIMRFASAGREAITNWWMISPGAIVGMLTRLGFGKTSISYHSQTHHLGHRLDEAPIGMSMFTVVGERI
jgi:SAM-dependent methyltransferase